MIKVTIEYITEDDKENICLSQTTFTKLTERLLRDISNQLIIQDFNVRETYFFNKDKK